MIASVILNTLGSIAEGVGPLLAQVFNGVVGIFYTAPTGDKGTGDLTFIGVLMLIGVAFTLVFYAFNFIRGLITRISRRN